MLNRNGLPKLCCAAALLGIVAAMPAEAATASVRYTYDQLGRVATALYDNGVCVVYNYDANGNRTAQTNTAFSGPQPMIWRARVWGCGLWTPS
jgi:carbohydrate-selective porin OprB